MSRKINIFNASCQDADVLAFMAATGINDSTILNALCVLVTSLKSNGVWAKCNAIYPMVGGTATTHKFNLKDPADTNAAFRLSFVGGWTHSSNGALPNGTNAYANTFLNPAALLPSFTAHLNYYSRTNSAPGGTIFDIGAANFISNRRLFMFIRSTNVFGFQSGAAASVVSIANLDSRGLFTGTRASQTAIANYKNGVLQNSNTISDNTVFDVFPIFIGALNSSGSPTFYSDRECAFASIGFGYTATDVANAYTAIQAFNTTLSRQV